jgi:hypothetical protein
MARTRIFGLGAALACAGWLFATALPAQTTRDKDRERRARSGFTLSTHASSFTYNVNNWLCGLDDIGRLCVNTFFSTTGGGGFWPIGTTNQYIFELGLQMAARDPLDPNRFVAAHCFNVSATQAHCDVAPFNEGVAGIFHSDRPEDLERWPDECYLTNPQTGERVKTLSQLDVCMKYWDGNPATTVPGGHPMGIEVVQHTLAFTVEGFRDMIFAIFKIQNISNTPAFRQFNPSAPEGGWTLTDMYVAVGHDADVSSDEVDENFGTFVPFLVPPTPGDPVGVPLWLGTIWQADFVAGDFQPYPQCGFCSNPGFVGTTLLRTPYNNTGRPIFNAAANRTVPPIDQATLEDLRLRAAQGDTLAQEELKIYEIGQSFGSLTTRGGVFPDPTDAGQSWRYYSGNLNPAEQSQVAGAPPGFGFVDQPTVADTRYFHATGPFNLAPGDSVEVIVGIVAGAPVLNVPGFTPGTLVPHGLPGDTTRIIEKIMGRGNLAGPAYPSIFKQVLDARTLFETNFLLPTPPPSPTVTAIPGDRQVTVMWSDDPVNARDPYFPIAQQRGIPGFREFDFEGFRVYRRVRPSAPWELIAQFDLKNGLTEVITTTDSVLTADSVWLPVRQDTAHAGTDTGLQFAIVDRGGRFPDPSNGPGLLNGVTYFYTVTSYDINSPFAPGGSSLESGQRLTRNLQDIGGAAATPRSTGANYSPGEFQVRVVGGDGSVLDPDAPEPAIDPETGRFAGPMPPANGFSLLVQPFVPDLVTSAGTATVTLDSVVPGNPVGGTPATYFVTASTPAGTIQRTVELAIGYFGDRERNDASVGFDLLRAGPEVGDRLRVNPAPLKLTGQLTVSAPDNYFNAQYGRGWVNGGTVGGVTLSIFNGPRWFVAGQQEPADPNAGISPFACVLFGECNQLPGGLMAGDIPGYRIYPVKSYFTVITRLRSLEGVLSTVRRAADIEVTWGPNGQPARVFDLTHKVDVPFHPAYRASWGFLTTESFASVDPSLTRDGNNAVLTASDWTCVAPYNALAVAGEVEFASTSCQSPEPAVLVNRAAIVSIDTTWAGGGTTSDARGPAAGARPGFAMYINGELFFFFGDQLPAEGSRWVLRTHVGAIAADPVLDESGTVVDVNNYVFAGAVRPPNVPGLRAEVVLSPTVIAPGGGTLARVHTVPDPYIVRSPLQTTSADRKILFVNLPNRATIRIFSLSGVLVDVVVHDDPSGGGTAVWDLRNRNNQYVASGVYFYHVQTPDGQEKVGKFTIVQAP